MPKDPTDAIVVELVTLLRGMKDMHAVIPHEGGATLERPAFIALMRIVEGGPLRPSALADVLCIDLSTVSRQLTALESAGWIARERDPDDRRAYLLRATVEGEEVLRHNKQARKDLLTSILADWSETDRARFSRYLSRFNTALTHNRTTANAARQEIS
jgi:DNA-binding MarR family transcriptional regulator